MAVAQKEKTHRDIQAEYDHLFQKEPVRDEDRAYRWFARQLYRKAGKASKILDLACGGGYFIRELNRNAPKEMTGLTGLDISQQALEIARKECPSANYLLGVAEALPFQDRTFDAITCLGSMEHFLDISTAIQEMKRIAVKDALFFILVPNMFWYKDILSVLFSGNRKTRNQTNERFASLQEWKDVLEKDGLRIMQVIKYNGIARRPIKQALKDLVIPLRFSYHFLFVCGGV